jgi:methionyl-tRNA formyltransferase
MNRELHIIYMGTPEFAVDPLRAILGAGYHVLAVITAPDKPAGRGQKLMPSPVKEFALNNNLKVLQPVSLKNPEFIAELKSYNANLQVVVAFRMLPEVVWQMPEYGTLNLHASLLPQYRGAAPINHAIINGETETGITTFFIEKEIDTGNIILSQKLPIRPSDDAGSLHDRLMSAGSLLVLDTLKLIETGQLKSLSQNSITGDFSTLKTAPKIFKEDCRIHWESSCIAIHNLIRGLSPFPGAFTYLIDENGNQKQVKIFKTSFRLEEPDSLPGTIKSDSKNLLSVACNDGILFIEELQLEGKKRLNTSEFLRGVYLTNHFRFKS